MALGIIGLGRLGGALARGLARAGVRDFYGYSRTRATAETIAAQAPGLQLLDSAAEVFERCDPICVWMGGPEASALLRDHAEIIAARRPFIITSTPSVAPELLGERWAYSLPNVNLATGAGGTLLTWGPQVSADDQGEIRAVLGTAGLVWEVSLEDLPRYSVLASSGPAIYARWLEIWADVMADRHGLDRDYCRAMVRQSAASTLALQELDGIDADEVVRRVAHLGGVTRAGLVPLEAEVPAIAQRVFTAMGE